MKRINETAGLDPNIVVLDNACCVFLQAATQGRRPHNLLDSLRQTVHIAFVDEKAIDPVANQVSGCTDLTVCNDRDARGQPLDNNHAKLFSPGWKQDEVGHLVKCEHLFPFSHPKEDHVFGIVGFLPACDAIAHRPVASYHQLDVGDLLGDSVYSFASIQYLLAWH